MNPPTTLHHPEDPLFPGGGGEPERAALATPEAETAALLDPAHQSLSDAIRITFRILQLAMIVLAALFVFSGFQSVKEGEQGIRLLFGKVKAAKLDPGFRFSFPFPVGELVKVSTGAVNVSLDEAFWPHVEDKTKARNIDQLPRTASLNPANDGSLLTADNNIAHTQWSVVYRRSNPEEYAQNIYTEDERALVMLAVQRGIVHASAQVNIDDLLKQSTGDAGSVASRAKEIAQRMLADAGSGIVIDQLALEQKMPPLFVRDKFNAVQAAAATANKEREEAEAKRQSILNAMAGAASADILAGIDEYEKAVDKGDNAGKTEALNHINGILENRAGNDAAKVSGQVTALLNDAWQYRSQVVRQAQSDVSMFRAKQEQFASNPLDMVQREWLDGLAQFRNRDSVQIMYLPSGTHTLELVINPDPDVVKELDRAQKTRDAKAAAEQRERERKAARFKTDTGLMQATPR